MDFAQMVYETNRKLSHIGYPGTQDKEAIKSFQKEQCKIEALTKNTLLLIIVKTFFSHKRKNQPQINRVTLAKKSKGTRF